MKDRPSPNQDARPAGGAIDLVILHYTGMRTGRAALDRLCDPAAEVSAHYLIMEDGEVSSLVPEERRAWHAGRAFWRGETAINARSIGVELAHPGHDWGYRPFAAAQIAALEALLRDIVSRRAIPPANVLGHSDVAPMRKADPGEFLPWDRLAEGGLARPRPSRVGPAEPDDAVFAAAAAAIGYEPHDPLENHAGFRALVAAFQRRWRPARVDGHVDAQTMALAAALADVA